MVRCLRAAGPLPPSSWRKYSGGARASPRFGSARVGFATFKEYVGNSSMNRGKGDGFRVITLYSPHLGLIFPLHVYDKLAKADITPDDILPALREVTEWIKENQK